MKTAIALLLSLPALSLAQQIAIGTYSLPTASGWQYVMAVGPDDAIWFVENPGYKIGRITTAGRITEFPLPKGSSDPYWITAGPDGALWFTEPGNIGRITIAGAITLYPLPGVGSYPGGITAGPDGALWFTANKGHTGTIGRITTAGAIAEYPVSGRPAIVGITTGPDGALWFAADGDNYVGRMETTGAITKYPVPTANCGVWDITSGPDGALWFTENNAAKVGRITTSGAITEYAVSRYPGWITTGPDRALWFGDLNQLGRITTQGTVTEYQANNTFHGGPTGGIVVGPDGELWFAVNAGIGEAVFVSANLTVWPPNGTYQSNLTFTGSGYASNETVQIYTAGVGSPVLARATADPTGSFSVMAPAPQSEYEPRILLGAGQLSGELGAASFVMYPSLILSPNSGPVGTTVTVQGYGFTSLMTASIYWNTVASPLGSAIANVHGTFSGGAALTFTVPAGSAPGANMVIAEGGTWPSAPPVSAMFTVQ
jgi:virginiamycin B lyase